MGSRSRDHPPRHRVTPRVGSGTDTSTGRNASIPPPTLCLGLLHERVSAEGPHAIRLRRAEQRITRTFVSASGILNASFGARRESHRPHRRALIDPVSFHTSFHEAPRGKRPDGPSRLGSSALAAGDVALLASVLGLLVTRGRGTPARAGARCPARATSSMPEHAGSSRVGQELPPGPLRLVSRGQRVRRARAWWTRWAWWSRAAARPRSIPASTFGGTGPDASSPAPAGSLGSLDGDALRIRAWVRRGGPGHYARSRAAGPSRRRRAAGLQPATAPRRTIRRCPPAAVAPGWSAPRSETRSRSGR